MASNYILLVFVTVAIALPIFKTNKGSKANGKPFPFTVMINPPADVHVLGVKEVIYKGIVTGCIDPPSLKNPVPA